MGNQDPIPIDNVHRYTVSQYLDTTVYKVSTGYYCIVTHAMNDEFGLDELRLMLTTNQLTSLIKQAQKALDNDAD